MHRSYGFRTAGFANAGWTVEQAASTLKELGYDSLELCLESADLRPETLDERRCAALRSTLDRLGLGIASLSYHGDREPLDERRANQERAVQAAHRLGTGILVINGEKTADRERQWPEHVSLLQRLCESAERWGVTLAVEPEPLLLVSDTQDMLDMLAAVGSERLKVNFDLGHAQVTDPDPAASIQALGHEIVHLHLEDIKDRVHRHLPFGEGDIDFAAVRAALDGIGYQGPYVADLFAQADPRAAAEQALVGMRRYFGD